MNLNFPFSYPHKNIIFSKLMKSLILKLLDSFLIFIFFLSISRYLGPIALGRFFYVLSFVLILEPLGRLGMRQILISKLSKKITDNSISLTCLLVELISYLLIILLSFPLLINFFKTENLFIYLFLSFAFLLRSGETLLNIFYVYKDPVKYGLIQILSNIFFILLSLLFIWLKLDLVSLSIIYIINYFIKNLIIIFFLKKKNLLFLLKKIELKNVKKYFLQGSLISCSAFLAIILFKIDIILINHFLGDFYTGIYTVPTKIISNIIILFTVVANTLIPYLPKKKLEIMDINLERLYKYMWLFSLLITLIFILLGPKLITFFFGREYLLSLELIPILGFSIFFNGIAIADNAYLNFYNIRFIILIKTIVSLTINIVLNIFLIPILGIKGAAISLLLATIFNGYGGVLIDKNQKKHYKNLFFPLKRI